MRLKLEYDLILLIREVYMEGDYQEWLKKRGLPGMIEKKWLKQIFSAYKVRKLVRHLQKNWSEERGWEEES